MLKFSRAQRSDALPVLRLYQLCSRQKQCTWNACYPGIEEVKKDLSDGGLYVLRSQGHIVACGSLILPEDGLETGDVFTPAQKPCAPARLGVLPDMQRQGLGKAMLCGILNAARAQGYDAARLLVGSGNIPALRLYENAGFIAVGETDAYGMHWLQMERMLQS